jgi:4-aminobutyrate aminotransferase-like enzyme
MKHALDNGMLILPSGKSAIRFRPPVIAGKAEIDQACAILAKAIRSVATPAGAKA